MHSSTPAFHIASQQEKPNTRNGPLHLHSASCSLPNPNPTASINFKMAVEEGFMQRKLLFSNVSAQGWHQITEHDQMGWEVLLF